MVGVRGGAGTKSGSWGVALLFAALVGCVHDDVIGGGGGGDASTGSFGDCFAGKCDDTNPCTLDTCDVGVCTHWIVDDGSPAIVDGADPHDCVDTVCVGGEAVDVALPDGSKCGATLAFDCAGGTCGCSVPADCGGDAECATRTCTGADAPQCGWDYAPAGALPPTQTAGDCKERVCTGSNAVPGTQAADDPASDMNPCTTDTCDAAGSTVHTPAAPGTGCGAGKECGGGLLVGTCCTFGPDVCAGHCGTLADVCGVAKTCPVCGGSKPVCVANVCVQCATDADCAAIPDKKQCASVGSKIGECVECDAPGSNSPECVAIGESTCKNDHECD